MSSGDSRPPTTGSRPRRGGSPIAPGGSEEAGSGATETEGAVVAGGALVATALAGGEGSAGAAQPATSAIVSTVSEQRPESMSGTHRREC